MPTSQRIPNGRASYAFGTTPGNRRIAKQHDESMLSLDHLEGTEACIFVLAPALAEVHEFRGEDAALIVRTKANYYRQALLFCLSLPSELTAIQQLAV